MPKKPKSKPEPLPLADLVPALTRECRIFRHLMKCWQKLEQHHQALDRMVTKYGEDTAWLRDAIQPRTQEPLDLLKERYDQQRKVIAALADHLPSQVLDWADAPERKGFGRHSLALIVGNAGDLSKYANPAKLWKRFGLGLVDGEAQRRCADAKKATAMGFSPDRRALMFIVGDCLMKGNGDGPYKALYDSRKAYETDRVKTKIHAHKRALRYMEKRLLLDLWAVWNGRNLIVTQDSGANPHLPASDEVRLIA